MSLATKLFVTAMTPTRQLKTAMAACMVAVALLLPLAAHAEPIKLKLAFFSSDRSHLYRSMIKPFVDAVNTAGNSRVEIDPYLSGKLGSDLSKQTDLLNDGTADIAFVVQPYEQARFPDTSVVELPGLFRNAAEATVVYSQLVASGTIRGFRDYFVIGLFASEPESIHLRSPITSLADLKGKIVRANNDAEKAIFTKLGIKPVFVPINETPAAILSGEVDGATVPPVPMIEFGIGRVAPYHYLLPLSSVPQALLMSRKKFDSLPDDVKEIIRRYSGPWLMGKYITINETATMLIMDQLKSDPKRTVINPSQADTETANAVFKSVVADYAALSPHNAELVRAARMAVERLRVQHEVPP
jgi:TRAP-type C4-dicarboxylate transport system substrate-binding protein